jgi:hypothetical protein
MKNVCSPGTNRETEGVPSSPKKNCNPHSSAPILKIPTRRSNVRSHLKPGLDAITAALSAGELKLSESRVYDFLKNDGTVGRYRRSICLLAIREFVRLHPHDCKIMLISGEWTLVYHPVVLRA